MSSRVVDLQRSLVHLEAARTLVQDSDRRCPISAAIRHVEGLLEDALDEASHPRRHRR